MSDSSSDKDQHQPSSSSTTKLTKHSKWWGSATVRLHVQELMIKGYPAHLIHTKVNERLEAGKKPKIKLQTVYRYMTKIKSEHSEWYLEVLKDQMAYVILHRQKLLELDYVKKMVYDEIDFQKKNDRRRDAG